MSAVVGDNPALVVGLQAAVPLWVHELRRLPVALRESTRMAWAKASAEAVAHKGDVLQFGGKRGEAAEVFNHLARGLAAAAFQPGGVDFAGLHFECEDVDELAGHSRVDSQSAGAGRLVVDAVRSL